MNRFLCLALAVVGFCVPVWAAPTSGVDCACSSLGRFDIAQEPQELAPPTSTSNPNSGTSPDGTLVLTAGPTSPPSQLAHYVITRGAAVVVQGDAAFWGFSPDSRSFVAYWLDSTGTILLDLYDVSVTPARHIHPQFALANVPMRILFSPHGKYFFLAQAPATDQALLQIYDVDTGTLALNASFPFKHQAGVQPDQTCPGPPDDAGVDDAGAPATDAGAPDPDAGAADPDAGPADPDAGTDPPPTDYTGGGWAGGICVQDGYGLAAWGFSPDPLDRTFEYTYVDGTTTVSWNLANLITRQAVHHDNLPASLFSVFSPCGDVVVLTRQAFSNLTAEAWSTDTLSRVTQNNSSFFGSDIAYETTPNTHWAMVGGATLQVLPLAANTARLACGTPAPGSPPTAEFSTAPATLFAQLPVSFNDLSTPHSATLAAWHWDFGDGSTSNVAAPVHTYSTSGIFTVSLTVVDSYGRVGTVSHSVGMPALAPPTAGFTFTPNPVTGGQYVTITDTSTSTGTLSRYWDFPTDVIVISQTPDQTQLVLKLCQDTTITLTVYDQLGQSAGLTQTIPVAPKASAFLDVPASGTLTDVAAHACPGETIRLAAGDYPGVVLDRVNLQGAGIGLSVLHDSVTLQTVPGLSNRISQLTVRDSTTGGIISGGKGVGILEDVEVAYNSGGGIIALYNWTADLQVRRAHVHHNTSTEGGGIYAFVADLVTVEDSEVAFNTATGFGGGIYLQECGRVLVRRNFVHDNTASRDGAASFDYSGEVIGNRFVGNTTTASNRPGNVETANVLFYDNLVAGNVGGGLNHRGQALVNDTIADNTGGPGLIATTFVSGPVLLNSIVVGNVGEDGGSQDLAGSEQSQSSLVGGTPCFRGPGDYHLALGSPAVDTGDTTLVPVALLLDVDGSPRVAASTTGGATTVDMGAYEFQVGDPPGTCVLPADAGVPDAGLADAGEQDAGPVDGGATDAGETDAGEDAGVPSNDSGVPVDVDSGVPDAGPTEAADAGPPDVPKQGCGGCAAGPADLSLLAGAFLLLLRRRPPKRRSPPPRAAHGS